MYFIGLIGTLLLAFSGLPQAILAMRSGNAYGVSQLTVLCWVFGELAMLVYALHFYPNDWFLLANYGGNFVIVSIICKYKYFPRKKNNG